MSIKNTLTASAFVVAASLSNLASAVTINTYTPASTLGQLITQTTAGFAAEGYDLSSLTLATAPAVYSSYVWSFVGDSIVGTSTTTNVDIMATLFSPVAVDGTVNLAQFASQLGAVDAFLDGNLLQAISFVGQLPLGTTVYSALTLANIPLTTPQAALLAGSSLQIKLTGAQVPVPATLVLLLGGLGLISATRRKE